MSNKAKPLAQGILSPCRGTRDLRGVGLGEAQTGP